MSEWYCCSCKRGCTKLLQYVKRVEKMQMELEEKHNVIKEEVSVMKEAMIEETDLTKAVDRRLGDLEAKVDYLQEKVDAKCIESVEGRLGVLEAKFVEMKGRMVDWRAGKVDDSLSGAGNTYASAVRKDKNLLMVKSTDKDCSVTDRKEELTGVLKNVKLVDTKFTKSGNIVLNFANESERQMAATKINNELKDLELKFAMKLSENHDLQCV